jgi:hypothetical protein
MHATTERVELIAIEQKTRTAPTPCTTIVDRVPGGVSNRDTATHDAHGACLLLHGGMEAGRMALRGLSAARNT